MSDAARFRQEAAKFLRNADQASDHLERRNWWSIAEEWLRLADIADPNERRISARGNEQLHWPRAFVIQ
jgi:hypothetical protein